jgi:signal transduction histidine kinase
MTGERKRKLLPVISVGVTEGFSSPGYQLLIAGLILVGITVIAAVWAIADRREEVFTSYRRELANLGIVLAEQTARSIQAIDLVLQETRKEVLATGIADPDQFKRALATHELYRLLHGRSENLPQADVIALIGADGILLNHSRDWPVPFVDLSDRDWYAHLRDRDSSGVFVSKPVLGKLTGAWTFYLARRLNGPNGEFLGAVVGGIHARYFEEFYRAITMHQGGSVGILRRDGTMLVRHPHVEKMMGERLNPQSPFYMRVAEGGGYYRSPGHVDGIARIVSLHPLRDYPLVIGVSIAEEAVLGEWHRQSLFIGVAALGIVIGFGVLFGSLAARSHRQQRHSAEVAQALEATVQQRTAELVDANAALTNENAERRAAEEELRRSETLLAQGQKLSHTASWTLQPATGEMRWSAELFDIFGTERAAVIPSFQLFSDRVHPDDRARFDAAMAMAVEGNTNFSCEVRIVLDGGAIRHVHALGEVQTDPLREKDVIGTVMDLTDRKRTEQALHDAEAELARTLRLATMAELTASIAHEINQPLAAIVVNASACVRFLARRPAAVANAREAASCVVSDGHRAGDVIARIRSLFAKQKPDQQRVNINEILQRVLNFLHGAMEQQRVIVRTEFAKAPLLVIGDPVQLQQVVVNLVTNAVEALSGISGRPRRLTIRSAIERGQSPEAVVVTVEDNGVGLGPDEVDRLFESFYTTKPGGIGVGLSISRSIIEAHGGSISAAPRKHSGARVNFTLPLARPRLYEVPCDSAQETTC